MVEGISTAREVHSIDLRTWRVSSPEKVVDPLGDSRPLRVQASLSCRLDFILLNVYKSHLVNLL